MAIPVIYTGQSALGYLQHEAFEFQPFAFNSPTSWTSSPLPPGMVLDTVTGKLTGPVTQPGVFNVGLRASNGDGASDVVVFTFGIEASASGTLSSCIDLYVDVVTRLCSLDRETWVPISDMKVKDQPALLRLKYGDDLSLRVVFIKAGVICDLQLISLKFAIKEFEPDAVLVESDAWQKMATGANANFKLHTELSGTALAAAVASYEGDVETVFRGLAEIEWLELPEEEPPVGPAYQRITSQTFRIDVVRDNIANA